MSVKSILFVYGGLGHETGALDSALSLAHAYRATLRILHIAVPPVMPAMLGISDYAYAAVGDGTVIDVLERDARQLAEEAKATAIAACRRQMMVLREGVADMVPGQAQVIYRAVTGEIEACLPPEAFMADLVVASHEFHPAADLTIALATLFEAGRPILLLPRDVAVAFSLSGHARTVVLAWDGSRASARALREAVPHMLHAQDVHILRVSSAGETADVVSEEGVLTYLRSHCVMAQFVHVERERHSIGEAIVEKAAALRADLLVMGAYGHGHVREMLLGGTTDHVVKHANLPLLLVR
jgi:nucleotide-binding universal stress UspA family protein